MLGVSALRYWVVCVDGCDSPWELPLSLTLGHRHEARGGSVYTTQNNRSSSRTTDTNLSSTSTRFMLCRCMMAKKMATRKMTMQHTLTLM